MCQKWHILIFFLKSFVLSEFIFTFAANLWKYVS